MVKVNGVYFMFASHESGWDANDNIYCTATSLTGPWSSWKVCRHDWQYIRVC